ncbi:MAG: FAD-dependent oxidoreductase, partial [Jiangellaceae bacterium]|nr:FAD-dependent oxidoreductase [Jiangellaceae bacterium]
YHPRGGRAHADRTVAALQRSAVAHGAQIRHGLRVQSVLPGGDGLEVRTADGELRAPAAVVAAGAWTSTLLADVVSLPRLTVTREQPAHFPPLDPQASWPSFIHHLPNALTRGAATPRGAYGLGSPDGIKVGLHAVGPVVHPDDPGAGVDRAQLRLLQEYVTAWVPGADVDRPATTPCLYTLTDTADFVLDRVGALTVATGFSGHGFKFTPHIGGIVADLVLDSTAAPRRFRLNPS